MDMVDTVVRMGFVQIASERTSISHQQKVTCKSRGYEAGSKPGMADNSYTIIKAHTTCRPPGFVASRRTPIYPDFILIAKQ